MNDLVTGPQDDAAIELDTDGLEPDDVGDDGTDHAAEMALPEASDLPRALKLVVTLEPAGGTGGLRALLALGAPGCDPVFQSLTVPDLASALAAVPRLMEAAITQWQTQPRYPPVPSVAEPQPQTGPATTDRRKVQAPAPQPATPVAPRSPQPDAPVLTSAPQPSPATPSDPTDTPGPAAPAPPPGQLSLFG